MSEPGPGGAAVSEQPHLSIGEVLALLREEFPEVTISKIRFLESQGLVAPERTPSGYRKFYDADVERLRWILQQQKDHYLPLKVIREKLDDDLDAEPGSVESHRAVLQSLPAVDGFHGGAVGAVVPVRSVPPVDPVESTAPLVEHSVELDGPSSSTSRAGIAGVLTAPDVRSSERESTGHSASELTVEPEDRDAIPGGDRAGHFTRSELARRSGLKEADILDLESHGLLPRALDDDSAGLFDEDALAVAHLARSFARHGIEPRHLKMYKHFAEREAALYETVVTSLLKQRNPKARRQAQETVAELARLGRSLRTAMLRAALQGAFDE